MAARHYPMDRSASILLWAGRLIAGAWAVIFLLSLTGEVASGYTPGGSTALSVLYFAEGGLVLAGVALSFWRAWVGGVTLIAVWAASCLLLLLGLEPEADVPMGLVISTLTELLPGLLLVAASLIADGRMRAGRGAEAG